MQYAVAAWLPILIFPQTMSPDFRYGFPATFAFVIAGLILIVVIQLLHTREKRQGKASGAAIEVGGGEDVEEEADGAAKDVSFLKVGKDSSHVIQGREVKEV